MIRILLRFWPVLLPALLCFAWLCYRRMRARKGGVQLPGFAQGPWYWVAVASLLIAVVCFLTLGFSNAPLRGEYEPAHIEGGAVVPGQVVK